MESKKYENLKFAKKKRKNLEKTLALKIVTHYVQVLLAL